MKKIITTNQAPAPLGAYSQAIQMNNTVYLAGQIPLVAESGAVIAADIKAQAQQVFANIAAVCQAAGGDLQDIVKLTIYLVNLNDFSIVNSVMQDLFVQPYPARTTIQVAKLPKEVLIEIDAIMCL